VKKETLFVTLFCDIFDTKKTQQQYRLSVKKYRRYSIAIALSVSTVTSLVYDGVHFLLRGKLKFLPLIYFSAFRKSP